MKPSNSRQTRSGGGLVAGLQPTEAAALCLILLGAALRVRNFLSGRGLWLDEAMIASNILSRSFRELLAPLDYQQYAPIGWLWSVKAATLLFGDGEAGLRTVALVTGLSTLPLTWIVARRYLPDASALLALAMIAVNWELIYYSAEVKPYGSDVLAALLALLLFSGPMLHPDRETAKAPRVALAVVLGMALQTFSFPVIFMLAGLGLSVLLSTWVHGNRRAALLWCALGAVWVAAFAALYVAFYQRGTSSDYLQAWRGVFVPIPGTSSTPSSWYQRILDMLLSQITGLKPLGVAAAALIAGAAWLARHSPWRLLALLSVFPFLWFASFVRSYPLVNRLLLFTAPVLSLIAASGLAWFVQDWKQRSERVTWALVTVGLLWSSFSLDMNQPWRGAAYGDPKPLLVDLARLVRPGDVLVTAGDAFPPFEYYAPRLGLAAFDPIKAPTLLKDPSEFPAIRQGAAGRGRVWVIVGHIPGDATRARLVLDKLIEKLSPLGSVVGRDARYRSALLLFDMSASSPDEAQAKEATRAPEK